MRLLNLRSKILVLLYHRIAREASDPWSLCVTPEHFAEHLEALQRFRRMTLEEVEPDGFPLRPGAAVVVTFDDGYSDNYRVAAPLLRRYDTPATFFITSGYLGATREYWWDQLERIVFESERLPALFRATAGETSVCWEFPAGETREQAHLRLYEQLQPLFDDIRAELLDKLADACGTPSGQRETRRPMTVDELRELAQDPLFEIGAHTITHPMLAARPVGEQYAEIGGSRACLEETLDRRVTSLSFPYGGKSHYSPTSVTAARECGFSRACTTEGHPVRRQDGPLEIGRLVIEDMDGDAFSKLLLTHA